MSDYQIRRTPSGVEVTNTSSFPFMAGIVSGIGPGIVFIWFFLGYETILLEVGVLAGLVMVAHGIYWIFFKERVKKVVFRNGSNRVDVSSKAIAWEKIDTQYHEGIFTLSISIDDETYEHTLYKPTIQLTGNGKLDIGFGCEEEEQAQTVVDKILELHQ